MSVEEWNQKGYVIDAIVRNYTSPMRVHHVDYRILHVHANGALDVVGLADGRRYGLSARFCEVVAVLRGCGSTARLWQYCEVVAVPHGEVAQHAD